MSTTEVVTTDLPHLITLLDDESGTVRTAVGERLFAYGEELDSALARHQICLGERQARIVRAIFRERGREWLKEEWLQWRDLEDECARLESGLASLSWFLNGFRRSPKRIEDLLNDLATRCRERGADAGFENLIDYLFSSGRFRGNRSDYYNPQNSDLAWVLESGRGNPISLTCLLILVGNRCGLRVDGCNYPGHFLARYTFENETLLVDCFNRGMVIRAEDLIEHQPFSSHEVGEAVGKSASTDAILMRVLRNLETAFSRLGSPEDQSLVRKLLRQMLP